MTPEELKFVTISFPVSWICEIIAETGKKIFLLFLLVVVYLLSSVNSFVTPWTVACQAPLSMGFPKQEFWSGLPFPSPGIFLIQGLNLCPLIDMWVLYHWATWEVQVSFRGLLYRSWRIRILAVFQVTHLECKRALLLQLNLQLIYFFFLSLSFILKGKRPSSAC